MKRNQLYTALGSLAIALIFAVIASFSNTRLEGLLWGLTGGGIGGGIMGVWRYYYWTRPKNVSRYMERIENDEISLHDERKEKFRNQSGRYAYILGLIITSIAIVVFKVLESLEVIANAKLIILYLFGYLVVQYVAGIIIYRYLNNKY